MKKLILVALLLMAVLLLSWWAKGTNFSLLTMFKTITHPTMVATPSATLTTPTTPTVTIPTMLITITPNGFVPDSITITHGTRITWLNKTGTVATISSFPANAYPALNIGDFATNISVSLAFPSAGTYTYVNAKNGKKGTITVR